MQSDTVFTSTISSRVSCRSDRFPWRHIVWVPIRGSLGQERVTNPWERLRGRLNQGLTQRLFPPKDIENNTLLADSLWSFLDKSGMRKRLCRHLQVPLICRSSNLFGWVRQVLYWMNQFYLCTHAYSGILLTLSAPTLHRKTNSCRFNFMREFWENYRLNVHF